MLDTKGRRMMLLCDRVRLDAVTVCVDVDQPVNCRDCVRGMERKPTAQGDRVYLQVLSDDATTVNVVLIADEVEVQDARTKAEPGLIGPGHDLGGYDAPSRRKRDARG
jgi:hypothetical protein